LHDDTEISLKELPQVLKNFTLSADSAANRVALRVSREASYQAYLSVLSELSIARASFPLHISEKIDPKEGGRP
jgi:biopolymer transport protein ExbD